MVSFERRKHAVQYIPQHFSSRPERHPLVAFKDSEVWSHGLNSKRVRRAVPYIDKRGFIHAITLCTWVSTAPQLLATITATVFKRLTRKFRHYSFRERPKPNDLFKVALLYSLTSDDYWFTRTLEILKRTPKVLSHLYRKTHKLDANTKVLYDQACQNALWFQSRVRKPNRVHCPKLNCLMCLKRPNLCHMAPYGPGSPATDYSVMKNLKSWAEIFSTQGIRTMLPANPDRSR